MNKDNRMCNRVLKKKRRGDSETGKRRYGETETRRRGGLLELNSSPLIHEMWRWRLVEFPHTLHQRRCKCSTS